MLRQFRHLTSRRCGTWSVRWNWAELAAAEGEVPVGAVVVHKPTGAIIGEGYNRREAAKSPLSHAEILAIRQASRTLGGWRLLQSAIYVTLEHARCVPAPFFMPGWIR